MTEFSSNSRERGSLSPADENIVQRLHRRKREAKAMGFRIRMEVLDDEQASWCEIGGVKTIFINLSQTAAEQLHQLDESLASFAKVTREPATVDSRAA